MSLPGWRGTPSPGHAIQQLSDLDLGPLISGVLWKTGLLLSQAWNPMVPSPRSVHQWDAC